MMMMMIFMIMMMIIWCSHVYLDDLDHFIVHLIIERIKQFVILFTYTLVRCMLLCANSYCVPSEPPIEECRSKLTHFPVIRSSHFP